MISPIDMNRRELLLAIAAAPCAALLADRATIAQTFNPLSRPWEHDDTTWDHLAAMMARWNAHTEDGGPADSSGTHAWNGRVSIEWGTREHEEPTVKLLGFAWSTTGMNWVAFTEGGSPQDDLYA